jgi:Arginyl tRNA synthetase N terminal domain.
MTFKSIIDEIENNLNKILDDMSISDVKFSVEPAKPGFGDVSSNVSFLLQNNSRKVQKILLKSYLKNILIFLKC